MAFTVTLTPYQLSDTEDIDNAKLNQLGNPTVSVTGGTTALTDWSPVAPTDGQTLFFSAATGKWTPAPLPVASTEVSSKVFSWAYFQ